MRESTARRVALGTGLLVVAAVAAFGVLRQSRPDPPEPRSAVEDASPEAVEPGALVARGERIYQEQRCSRCHSIAGEGGRRGSLDGVGDRLTTDELRLWVVAPQKIRPGVRKPDYDHLPPRDVEALVAYLRTLSRSAETES